MTVSPLPAMVSRPRPAAQLLAAGLVLLLTCLLGNGCLTTSSKKKSKAEPAEYLSFHTFQATPDPAKGTIATEWAPGKVVHVRPAPLLTSFEISAIEPIPAANGKEGVGLRCHLSRTGVNSWMQLSGDYRGQYLVLMVDGQFRSFITVQAFSDRDYFELTGPFSEQEATAIIAGVKKNYKAQAVE